MSFPKIVNQMGPFDQKRKNLVFLFCRPILDIFGSTLLSSCEITAWKNSGLNGIQTHDLCNTSSVLYWLSYQAIWELVILWVRNIPVEGEECKWIYERWYIWTAEKDMNKLLI